MRTALADALSTRRALARIWSIAFLAVRTNAVVLGLGYAFVYCKRNGVRFDRLKFGLVLSIVAAWGGLELFGIFRATYQGDLGEAVETVASLGVTESSAIGTMLGSSELAHPFYTSMELRSADHGADLGGASYMRAFQVLIPLSIYPDRPNSLAQEFVARHYPSLAERGGGAAFSMIGEAWWNFGAVFGPFLVGLVYGLVHWLWDRRARLRPEGVLAMLTPYLLFHVGMIQRYESANLLKQVLSITIPVGLAILAARVLWMATGRSFGDRVNAGKRSTISWQGGLQG